MKRHLILIIGLVALLAASCATNTGVVKKAVPPKEQSQVEIESGATLGQPVKDNE